MHISRSILSFSLLAPAFASIPHIYFGSYSGEGLAGTWGTPGSLGMCYYIAMTDDMSPCDGVRNDPEDESGGFPGQSGDGPNFCHMKIPGVASNFVLDRNGGDCPYDGEHERGTWYADVIDKDNGNAKVGRCVNETRRGPTAPARAVL